MYIYSESATNKLTQVTDNNIATIGGSPLNMGDIKNGQTSDNYTYFPNGSLKSDLACLERSRREEIAYIDWYPSGTIYFLGGTLINVDDGDTIMWQQQTGGNYIQINP